MEPMTRPYPFPDQAGIEPALAEILTDPTMHKLLERDGLVVADVCDVIERWRHARERDQMRLAAE